MPGRITGPESRLLPVYQGAFFHAIKKYQSTDKVFCEIPDWVLSCCDICEEEFIYVIDGKCTCCEYHEICDRRRKNNFDAHGTIAHDFHHQVMI